MWPVNWASVELLSTPQEPLNNVLRLICVIVVSASLFPARAAADPQFEIAGGYSLVDYKDSDLLPVGWFASVAAKRANPRIWLAVVAEVTGEYATTQTAGRRVHQQAFAFLDGPRVGLNIKSRTSLFVELLLGVAHDQGFLNDESSANRFAWRPGAGLDAALTTRVSVRFQGGARFVSGDDTPTAFQFLTGIVFSGKRP